MAWCKVKHRENFIPYLTHKFIYVVEFTALNPSPLQLAASKTSGLSLQSRNNIYIEQALKLVTQPASWTQKELPKSDTIYVLR
jgi:hypothetical protein